MTLDLTKPLALRGKHKYALREQPNVEVAVDGPIIGPDNNGNFWGIVVGSARYVVPLVIKREPLRAWVSYSDNRAALGADPWGGAWPSDGIGLSEYRRIPMIELLPGHALYPTAAVEGLVTLVKAYAPFHSNAKAALAAWEAAK